MHLDSVLTEHVKLTGNAVVPAATDRKNQVAIENGLVGVHGTVHAEHTERKFMVSREGAEAEQSACHGGVQLFGEFLHLAASARNHGTVAHEQERLLGFLQVFSGLFDAFSRSVARDLVTWKVHLVGKRCGAGTCSHILRQVNKHGARTATACNVEGFLHNARQVVGVLHQVRMLHGGKCHTAGIAFLEGVLTQVRSSRLSGKNHDRARIHKGGVDTGKGVGGARTRSDESDADLAGLASVTVGHVGSTLFVAGQHYFNIGIQNGIEHRDGRSTGITENGINSFALEAFDDHLCAT